MSQTVALGAQLREAVDQLRCPSRAAVRAGGADTAPTDHGGGLGDPRLDALSTAMVRLAGDYGRSPASATSWRLGEDCVVTALEDSMTVGEQELVEGGDARLVRQLRSAFAAVIADEYVRAAERALGREVIAHRSELICASHICLEIFQVAEERGRPSASPFALGALDPQQSP